RFSEPRGPVGRQFQGADSQTTTDADGWYEGYVVPQKWVGAKLGKLPEGYARNDAGEVLAGDDPAADLPPLRVEKVEPLVVRVVDADGKPVVGARVEPSGAAVFLDRGAVKPTGPDGTTR